MRSMTVSGNLGRAPQLRENKQTNEKFYSVPLAEDNSYKDPQTGEKVQRTEWFEIVLQFKRFEKITEFLKKGTRCTVIGYPTIHTYTNDDKKLVRMFRINAHQIDFYNPKEKFLNPETGEVIEQKEGENLPY